MELIYFVKINQKISFDKQKSPVYYDIANYLL